MSTTSAWHGPQAPKDRVMNRRLSEAALADIIDQARGRTPADLVIKNVDILDISTGEIGRGDIAICGDRIVGTYDRYRGSIEIDGQGLTAVPGFIDSHVHCESTLVSPLEFDRCVLPKGTTTAICDPHEICNVLGAAGLEYFLRAACATVMDLFVQLSSCVPATDLETSGARLTADDLLRYKRHPKVLGLAELMNVPGVLSKDPEVLRKLSAFSDAHIDGHCPLLSGHDLNAYIATGIRNCHETTSLGEAQEKLRKGLQVLIREGTVSKDLQKLYPIISAATSPFVGLCTDDRNPLDIHEEGHIDHLIRAAIRHGAPPAHVYRAATWSSARSFGLRDRGMISPAMQADVVLLDDLRECRVRQVICKGRPVTPDLFAARPKVEPVGLDSMRLGRVTADLFRLPGRAEPFPVIGIIPGSIITEHLQLVPKVVDGACVADIDRDLLKVVVLCRHGRPGIGRGFVKGFGLRKGALASSVGHDSHNVCVIGANDDDMACAVNRLIEIGGGFVAACDGDVRQELALPIAGLMSDQPFEFVASRLRELRDVVRDMGSTLPEPFLQLAFLPLPVIPHLRITDKGIVDVDRFALVA